MPVGRGRLGKSTLASAIYEEMRRRDHPVLAWDLDQAESLAKYIDAQRPSGGGPRARRAGLENGMHQAITVKKHVIVDFGADDVVVNQVKDKLPDMAAMLVEAGLETVGVHVIGPKDKDMAYFRAVRGENVFAREIVVLSYGMLPDDVSPTKAFEAVRKEVGDYCHVFAVRKLSEEITEVIDNRRKGQTLWSLTDWSQNGLIVPDALALRVWLSTSIEPIVDELLDDPSPDNLPEAA